jgi:hypothetical protein
MAIRRGALQRLLKAYALVTCSRWRGVLVVVLVVVLVLVFVVVLVVVLVAAAAVRAEPRWRMFDLCRQRCALFLVHELVVGQIHHNGGRGSSARRHVVLFFLLFRAHFHLINWRF